MGMFDDVLAWIEQKNNASKVNFLSMLPTTARTLVDTLAGITSPITEKNFTQDELNFIKQLIAYKEKTNPSGEVNYNDYLKFNNEQRKNGGKMLGSVTPSLWSMKDPYGNVQTTLGRFRYAKSPDGGYHVTDVYDFNPTSISGDVENIATGPLGAIRVYAGRKLPPGSGRPVQITVPNVFQDTTYEPPLFPDTTR